MKPNKKSIINKLLLTMVFLLLVIAILVIRGQAKSQNIVLKMKDGLENPEILEYYKQDIIDVETITKGSIKIKYYDVDLNEDGLMDKIVHIASPLHTGAHGDSLHILINQGESYENILCLTIFLYEEGIGGTPTEVGEIYIMPEKTNGFHNIRIISAVYGNETIWQYSEGSYERAIAENEVVAEDYIYKILIPENLTGPKKGLPLKNGISANMISIDNEEEQIARKDEFNYEPYLHKIWIPESWKGTDLGVSYDDTISFYISNIDRGYMEGKVTEGGSIEPGDGAPRFSGEVKNGIAKCHFQNDYGNEGEMELVFNNEGEIQVTLTYIKLNNPEKIEKIKAGSIYKPYNLEDEKDTVTVISEVKTNINSWGNVKLVVGRFDTTRAFMVWLI